MAGSLTQYWKKRDFGVTSEPKGEVARPGKKLAFVVQKHAASRLHYDFRLEVEGTMVSWAVPKGPSLDPLVRRMAVHVEDHPIGYNKFEGVIPAGQYGAGTVEVWDRGTWTPLEDPGAAIRQGKLKFEMQGEKLRGRWMLVRINKRKDERQEQRAARAGNHKDVEATDVVTSRDTIAHRRMHVPVEFRRWGAGLAAMAHGAESSRGDCAVDGGIRSHRRPILPC